MNDTKWTAGEPVEESPTVDDVVVSAEDSLAEAEAAREGVGSSDLDPAIYGTIEEHDDAADPVPADAAPVDAAPVWTPEPRAEEVVETESAVWTPEPSAADAETAVWTPEPSVANAETAVWTPDAGDSGAATVHATDTPAETATRAYDPAPEAVTRAHDPVPEPAPEAATRAYDPVPEPATVVAAPVVAASEPVVAQQPIFVQAPEAPRPRGNRAAAGAIGILAALSFAVLYLGAGVVIGLITGDVTGANLGQTALAALLTLQFWVPVLVFFIAFWLLGAIINRGRWGAWVILGLFVGLAGYAGHLLGQLVGAPFWELTAREGAALVESQLFAPLAILSFIFARELTVWFGAWVAARGKRVTELNIEAQREYERTLEAGPQLAA